MTTEQFQKALKAKPTHSSKWIIESLANLEIEATNKVEITGENKGKLRKFEPISISDIKKYDLVRIPTFGSPHYVIVHYVIVHKVKNNTIYGLPITSRLSCHTMFKIEGDRRFSGSYITNTYIYYPLEESLDKIIAVYEDKKEADKAFKMVKEYLRELLRW